MTQTWSPEEQKEHRRLWVEALRSGKYAQVTGALKSMRGAGMCCLGVACDISGLGGWETDAFSSEPGYLTETSYEKMKLPLEVQEWLGLATFWGTFDDPTATSGTEELYQLNDSGTTFAEIADIIESEPDGLIAKVEA